MNHLKSMTIPEIGVVLKELGQPAFRAKQVFSWLHKGVRSFEEMTNLSKDFRNECIIFAIIYVTLALIATRPKWIFLVATLVFPFINLWHHTAVRKRWASERIRFANN